MASTNRSSPSRVLSPGETGAQRERVARTQPEPVRTAPGSDLRPAPREVPGEWNLPGVARTAAGVKVASSPTPVEPRPPAASGPSGQGDGGSPPFAPVPGASSSGQGPVGGASFSSPPRSLRPLSDAPTEVKDIERCPVWNAMRPDEQRLISTLVHGTTDLASRARLEMAITIITKEFQNATPREQGDRLLKAIREEAIPFRVAFEKSAPNPAGASAAYSVSAGTPAPSHQFRGSGEPATSFEIRLRGRAVPVFVAERALYGELKQASVEDIAGALARLPAESLALVRAVRLNPVGNPQDDHWDRVYRAHLAPPGEPSRSQPSVGAGKPAEKFRSSMTWEPDGTVTVYPITNARTAKEHSVDFVHETGHILSQARFGPSMNKASWWRPGGAWWRRWDEAQAKDGLAVSKYGRNSSDEDLAEATALYLSTRGTPAHDEYRRLHPNRFAILDESYPTTPASGSIDRASEFSALDLGI